MREEEKQREGEGERASENVMEKCTNRCHSATGKGTSVNGVATKEETRCE